MPRGENSGMNYSATGVEDHPPETSSNDGAALAEYLKNPDSYKDPHLNDYQRDEQFHDIIDDWDHCEKDSERTIVMDLVSKRLYDQNKGGLSYLAGEIANEYDDLARNAAENGPEPYLTDRRASAMMDYCRWQDHSVLPENLDEAAANAEELGAYWVAEHLKSGGENPTAAGSAEFLAYYEVLTADVITGTEGRGQSYNGGAGVTGPGGASDSSLHYGPDQDRPNRLAISAGLYTADDYRRYVEGPLDEEDFLERHREYGLDPQLDGNKAWRRDEVRQIVDQFDDYDTDAERKAAIDLIAVTIGDRGDYAASSNAFLISEQDGRLSRNPGYFADSNLAEKTAALLDYYRQQHDGTGPGADA